MSDDARHADEDVHDLAVERFSNFDWAVAAASFWALSLGIYWSLEVALFTFPPVIKYAYPLVMILPAAFFGGFLVYALNRAKIEAQDLEANHD